MDARAYTEIILSYEKYSKDFFKQYNTIDRALFNQGATIILNEQLSERSIERYIGWSDKLSKLQHFNVPNLNHYIELLDEENLERIAVLFMVNGIFSDLKPIFNKITLNERFKNLLLQETRRLVQDMHEACEQYAINKKTPAFFSRNDLDHSKARAFYNSKLTLFLLVPEILIELTEELGAPTDFYSYDPDLTFVKFFIQSHKDNPEYVKLASLIYSIQGLAFGGSKTQFNVLHDIKKNSWPISIDSLITSTARKVGTKWLDSFLEPFLTHLSQLEKNILTEEYIVNTTEKEKKCDKEFLEECFLALKNIVSSKNKRSQNKSIFFIDAALQVAGKLRHIDSKVYTELVEPCIIKHGETIESMDLSWFKDIEAAHPEHFDVLILPHLEKKVNNLLLRIEQGLIQILDINQVFSNKLPTLSEDIYEKLQDKNVLQLLNQFNYKMSHHLTEENPSFEVLNRLLIEQYNKIDTSDYDLMNCTDNSKMVFFQYLKKDPSLFKKGIATFLLPFLPFNSTEIPLLIPYHDAWKSEPHASSENIVNKIDMIFNALNGMDGFKEEWQKQVQEYQPLQGKTFLGSIITVLSKLFLNQEINGHGLALMLTIQNDENNNVLMNKALLLETLTDLRSSMSEELDLIF